MKPALKAGNLSGSPSLLSRSICFRIINSTIPGHALGPIMETSTTETDLNSGATSSAAPRDQSSIRDPDGNWVQHHQQSRLISQNLSTNLKPRTHWTRLAQILRTDLPPQSNRTQVALARASGIEMRIVRRQPREGYSGSFPSRQAVEKRPPLTHPRLATPRAVKGSSKKGNGMARAPMRPFRPVRRPRVADPSATILTVSSQPAVTASVLR